MIYIERLVYEIGSDVVWIGIVVSRAPRRNSNNRSACLRGIYIGFLVKTINVVVRYANQIIHFCFISGVARTINVQDFILTKSLHASES
jgi:hypothetical protein